jgi:predicted TIM-barrel fold metal-dependent hydrolase
LQPDKPDFGQYLERFAKNPLWRGIRYARVWVADQGKAVLKPGIVDGLRLLAQTDLSLDMANPSIDLMRGALLAADAVPNLRIVMDHMPQFDPAPEAQADYDRLITELAAHPNFFVKLSQVIHPDRQGVISPDLAAYRARLDRMTAAFGEDRVMFGSNWPETVGKATIPQAVSLMRSYFAGKPKLQAEKYFWRNSRAIYKWRQRTPQQSG